jgi:hypothetical protein
MAKNFFSWHFHFPMLKMFIVDFIFYKWENEASAIIEFIKSKAFVIFLSLQNWCCFCIFQQKQWECNDFTQYQFLMSPLQFPDIFYLSFSLQDTSHYSSRFHLKSLKAYSSLSKYYFSFKFASTLFLFCLFLHFFVLQITNYINL